MSSLPNKAAFWAGGKNFDQATKWAADNGGTTLEGTPGGKWLDDNLPLGKTNLLPFDDQVAIWDRLSERYAEQASGVANAFVDAGRWNGTFYRIEVPALEANPNVTFIAFKNGNTITY